MEGMGKKRCLLMVMDSSLTAAAQTTLRGGETGMWEWMGRERAAVDPVHCLPLSLTTRGEEAAGGGARCGRRSPEDVTVGICCKGPPEEESNCRRMRCSEPRHHRRHRRSPLKLVLTTTDAGTTPVESSSFTQSIVGNSSSEDERHIHTRIAGILLGESTQSNWTTDSDSNDTSSYDYPSQSDWDDLSEVEIFEDIEMREMEEIDERVEKPLLTWDEVYRNARKSERMKPEGNERDEGELERTGQPVCIYEIYRGEGAWPFLHHGSLYRGITLSKGGRRPRSDDVDAVMRLLVLDNTYYRDLLCEFGAMFAIANRIDIVHKLPWIGFQSWRAAGRKVSLSESTEETLE